MRLPSPVTSLTGQTYHTASGVQLAIRDAAEILTATPIVLAAVPHWPKGIQEDLQAIKGGRGHQLFSVGRTEGMGGVLGARSYLASQIMSQSLLQKSKINQTLSLELTNYRHSPYLGIEPRL